MIETHSIRLSQTAGKLTGPKSISDLTVHIYIYIIGSPI